MATILIVEDEAGLRRSMAIALRRAGYRVVEADTRRAAVARIEAEAFDLAIFDQRLPDGDAHELLRDLRGTAPETEAIVITAFGTVDTAVSAMRLGAYDYLQKPFLPERLIASVDRALDHRRLRGELRRRRVRAGSDVLVGDSAAMHGLRRLVERAGAADMVLVTGETGSGKDLVARAVHDAGGDPDAPFVAVNCGAIPEALIESELFGHVKGAYSGAGAARRGLIAEAEGGTLFLDEISELPLALQPRLLRFLESHEARAVGADQSSVVPCRVVAATNRDLAVEVAEGRFRADLFYRVDVFRIGVPPLRDHLEDLPQLVEHLLGRVCARLRRPPPTVPPEAVAALGQHDWPGNVRELEHALERAVLMEEGTRLGPEAFSIRSAATGSVPAARAVPAPAPAAEGPQRLEDIERRHVLDVLERHGGDRTRTARALGISRSTLRRKLQQYGVGARER